MKIGTGDKMSKSRSIVLGLIVSTVSLIFVVVICSKSVQFGALDPYKGEGDSTSTELLSESQLEQDPFLSETAFVKNSENEQRSQLSELSSRDAAAYRLLGKAKHHAEFVSNPKAARLLEEARAELEKKNPAIQALIESAKRLDSNLIQNGQIHRSPRFGQSVGSKLADGQRTSGLYFAPGGYGPYPRDDDSSSSADLNNDWDDEEGPSVAEVTDGPSQGQGWDYAADDWRDMGPAVSAIGAAVSKQHSPLDWFLNGPKGRASSAPLVVVPAVNHPRPVRLDDGRDYDEPETTSVEITPVLERIEKLIDLREKARDIEAEQEKVLDDVYDDAQNGRMATVNGGAEADAFSQGFLQGAVEASKKSLEQQKEFSDLLQHQEEVVARLEAAVQQLEEAQRQGNWAKTAAQYPEPSTTVSPPVRANSAPPSEVVQPLPAPVPEPVPAPVEPAAPAAPAPAPHKFVTGQPEQTSVPIFNMDFYMEAMCPGCMHFTTTVLAPVLNVLEDFIELRAIPFGNAAIVNGSVMCQHGPDECVGNKIELCMMRDYPGWRTWFPAFKCIESSDDVPLVAARTCLADHGMDANRVIACALSSEGDTMQLKAGNETISLNPPHQFTPWVVVNGQPVGEEVMDLQNWLCQRLPEEHRATVAACTPSKFKSAGGRSQLLKDRARAPKGLCYPSLKWDGEH